MGSDRVQALFDELIDAISVQVAGSEAALCNHMRRHCDRMLQGAAVLALVDPEVGSIEVAFVVDDEVSVDRSVDLDGLLDRMMDEMFSGGELKELILYVEFLKRQAEAAIFKVEALMAARGNSGNDHGSNVPL